MEYEDIDGTHDHRKLIEHILPLSNADNFEEAKYEWYLEHAVLLNEMTKCPCGHPIKELCFIKNTLNDNTTVVGNVCVKQFGIDTGALLQGMNNLVNGISTRPNEPLREYAINKGWITEWEYSFLEDVSRKRRLSRKQEANISRIAAKISQCINKGIVE